MISNYKAFVTPNQILSFDLMSTSTLPFTSGNLQMFFDINKLYSLDSFHNMGNVCKMLLKSGVVACFRYTIRL